MPQELWRNLRPFASPLDDRGLKLEDSQVFTHRQPRSSPAPVGRER